MNINRTNGSTERTSTAHMVSDCVSQLLTQFVENGESGYIVSVNVRVSKGTHETGRVAFGSAVIRKTVFAACRERPARPVNDRETVV